MSRGTVATLSAEQVVRLAATEFWIRQRGFVFGDWMRDHFLLHLPLLPMPNRHRDALAQGVVNATDLRGFRNLEGLLIFGE
jgi:hypothetical protein